MYLNFKTILKEMNAEYVLSEIPYIPHKPSMTEDVIQFFAWIVKNDIKTLVDPDADPDGFFATLEVQMMFEALSFKNYEINKLPYKRHGIDQRTINKAISEKFGAVIILDSSSNSMAELETLASFGLKVLVIDHHDVSYSPEDYPNNVIIANCKLDGMTPYRELSAGALTALFIEHFIRRISPRYDTSKFLQIGAVTLYTDSMDLSNPYNISIIQQSMDRTKDVPSRIKLFMNEWSGFDRNFISFTLAPRLNALIRSNMLDLVHMLLFDNLTNDQLIELLDLTETNYKSFQALIRELSDVVEVEEYEEFVLCNLDRVIYRMGIDREIALNSTGLVANKIAAQYGKLCVSLLSKNEFEFKGSVRDPLNRDVLNIFNKFCKAGGHGSAFGIRLPRTGLESFINTTKRIERIIKKHNTVKPIEVDGDRILYPELVYQMSLMADYNEYSGGKLPLALIKKTITPDMRIYRNESYISIKWGDITLKSFMLGIDAGDKVYVKPVRNNNKIQYIINNLVGG